MKEHTTEIAIALGGIITSVSAWYLGGKQRSKNESKDTITKGADQIVETSNKLLTRLDTMLEEERGHRASCEKSLREHKEQIDKLGKDVANLRKLIKD